MRKYLHINLGDRTVETEEWHGESVIRAGRHHIAKTLLERGAAKLDPLSPENPLIFSAGPFAGSSFSNANRLSVGCKSPLTGGVKESNAGGTCARCSAGTRADRARIFPLGGASAPEPALAGARTGLARRQTGGQGFPVGYWAFGFGARVSTGPPASRQAVKPPPMWQTGARPMSCTALAPSAERQPMLQKNTKRLPDWNTSLA